MQPVNNDSSQCRRSVYGSNGINYVGLTLKEFHSSANHKEGLHLMLNFNMTELPCNPAKLSNQAIQFHDRHGLQVQEEIRHLNQEQHQQNAQVDSCSSSQQLVFQHSTPPQQVLEWNDTESISGDCTIPISWMNEANHKRFREPEAQVQNVTLAEEPHNTSTDPRCFTSRQSHGWLKNTFGESIARSSKDQCDLFARQQLTSRSFALSSKLFGHFDRPHSTPGMSSYPVATPCGFDTNFFIPVDSSSQLDAEYPGPVSHLQLTRGNIVRSNFAPAQEELISPENGLTRQPRLPSMSLQLKFGGQSTKATASVQELPVFQASDALPGHQHEDGSTSDRVELLEGRMSSEGYLDMSRGYSNILLNSLPVQPTIRLPPLRLEAVLGASSANVPNLHTNNVERDDKNWNHYLHSANPETPLFLTDSPSSMRLNSTPGSSNSSMVGPTHATMREVQSESFLPPQKKRVAPRRSRFDPHDTPCTFVTERIRREKLTEKYNILKSLIPKSTKVDRASIIEETIAHVKSLKSQITCLEKLKQAKLRKTKRQKVEAAEDHAGLDSEQSGDVHCQWLRITSQRGTEVDIRILQDELLVSIVQKHLPRFLLRMVTALESKLKLEILNASGSIIDGHDVYNFKVKITGNSCAVANEIMTKMLDTVDSVF